jgi:hypothetical protein
MSEMFMPPAAPPAPGGENPLAAAMGAGPGGADTAQLPPELMAALGGGQQGAEAPPEIEPASLEAALEHFRLGVQMLQELQVVSSDDQEMQELHGLMGPVQKMLGDRSKQQAMASASGPKLGGGGGA